MRGTSNRLSLFIFAFAFAILSTSVVSASIADVDSLNMTEISTGDLTNITNNTVIIPSESIDANSTISTQDTMLVATAEQPAIVLPQTYSLSIPRPVFDQSQQERSSRFIVHLKKESGVSEGELKRLLGKSFVSYHSDINVVIIGPTTQSGALTSVSAAGVVSSALGVGSDSLIEYVEEDRLVHTLLADSVPMVNASYAYGVGYNGTGVKVCILDTGIDYFSTQLPTNFVAKDFTNDWCIDGASGKSAGYFQKFKWNVPSSINDIQVGLWWENAGNNFYAEIYNSTGSLVTNVTSASVNFNYSTINVTPGVYDVVMNWKTIVSSSDWPTFLWGSDVANATYDYGRCMATPNPVYRGDPKAFYNNYSHSDDASSHGAHVAGIIAKQSTPQGVSPNVTLYIGKVLGSGNGVGFHTDIIDGISWCIDNNASIISMSLGDNTSTCSDIMAQKVEQNAEASLFVIAAGNDFLANTIETPGCVKNALTVGAVDKSNVIADFSSRGPSLGPDGRADRIKPDVTAPGVSINSTISPNMTGLDNGTSMAAPHVSGAAALLKQRYPAASAQLLKALLIGSTDLTDCDNNNGCGMINVGLAFTANYTLGSGSAAYTFNGSSPRFTIVAQDPYNSHNVTNFTLFVNDVQKDFLTDPITVGRLSNSTTGVMKIIANGTGSYYIIYPNTIVQDTTPPSINSAAITNPDYFYSSGAGNDIVNVSVNASDTGTGIQNVTADFRGMSLCGASGIVNLTLVAGLYQGSCNVSVEASTANFTSSTINITALDKAGYQDFAVIAPIILYNMTTPTSSDPCMQFNVSETTNFSTELNFSAINLKLAMMRNGSAACNGIALPWGNTMKKVMFLNFTAVNLSTQAQAAKLQNLASAINVSISPPKAYENSRIYVNSTYFAELNTTTRITFYDLPFSSTPNVTADVGAAGVSTTTWAQGAFDASYNTSIGNLTLVVNGFSGYNATDNIVPIVSIVSPTASQNSTSANVLVNVTLNGTGTEISAASFRIGGVEVAAYNSTSNTANCSATVSGSELYRCVFSTTLTDGAKSLNVTAYDYGAPAPGKMGSAVVNFLVDTAAPTIVINAPANGLNTSVANVTFNWTATDALRASITCNLTIDGAFNRSVTANNGTSTTTTATSNFSDGPHNWTVSCWDDLNNTNSTVVYNFTVDTVAPIVNLMSPANQTNTSSTSIAFNFNATDALPINCSLYIDAMSSGTNASVANNTETSWTVTVNANTNHSWYVACTDNAGNNNVSEIRTLLVDNAAPTITLNAPANGFNTANANVTFNWTATDALRASITCNFTIDGIVNRSSLPVTNGTWHNTSATSNFADGVHNWSVSCWDDLGNTNSTDVRSFTVDTTAPTVTINAPAAYLNTSTANVVFNWTATDALIASFTCNLTIDGAVNKSNMAVTNGTWYNTTATSNFADGVHNWSVTCWDSLNNTNSPETRFFTVDTVPPAVTLVLPVSAANLSTANVTFNFTAIDALTNMSCNLSINGIANQTFSATNGSNAVYASTNFTDGNYNWSVSCWDNAGNVNSSAVARAFTVDTTAPVITIVSPANNTMYNISSISVNISVTEAHPDTTWFFNGSANETYTSSVSVIYADGDYNLTVWSNDTAGHLSTAVANFTVDTTFPTINFVAPTFNSSSALMVNYIPINVSASDTHLANLTIQLYNSSRALIDSSNTTSSNLFANFSGLPDGTYYFNATAYDTAGHANSTATWNVTLDTTAPVISLNSPIAYLNTSAASLSFNWTAMDAMRQNITCTLMIDGTANNTTSVQNGTPYSSALIVLNESIHNWQVNCSDDIGNWNISVLRNFTVDRTAPALTLALPDGSNLSSNVFTLNFTALDALSGINSSACMYSINNGANVSVPNCVNTTANTSVTNGQVNFTIYSSDMAGNTNSSAISFNVDMVAPTITISVPIANSVLSNNSTTLNFTAVDTNTGLNSSTCYYKLNGVRTNITNCTNMTLPEMPNGAQTIIVYAKDNIGNEGSNGVSFVVDVSGTNTTVPLNNTTTVSNNATVIVTPYSPAANLTLGSNATNASLNMSDISSTNGSITSVNLTNPINVTANTSLGNVIVQIPGSLTINGSSSWNGVLYLPSVQATAGASPTDSGTNAVNGVVQLGFTGEQLNFSNAVRILIPGMSGKLAGYVRGTTFTKITTACNGDNQTAADAQLTGSVIDCVTSSGSNMVIWTKHFTQFVAYTNTPPSSGGNTGSGSSGGSGGGPVGSGGGAGVSIKQSATLNVDVGLGKTCAVTIEREMKSEQNLSTLTTTLENTGGSECSMTDFVFADTIPADFPALNVVTFTPQYTSREGWTVNFNFPTFAAGESKTLSYSANQWIKTSLAKNFTVYTMTAKKQQAATQPATNTTATQIVEAPSVWNPTKLPLAPTAPTANVTPQAVQPTPTDNSMTSLVLTGLIVIVVLGGIGGLALYLKGKKKGL